MKKLSDKSIRFLERLESNYKLIFTIVMSAPLILALENLTLRTNNVTGVWEFKGLSEIQPQHIWIFFIFFMIYTRFFLGDMRYLDEKYLERQTEDAYGERYSPLSRFIDFYSLLLHAVFFFILSSAVTNFISFYKIDLVFLFLNSAWLLFAFFTTESHNRHRIEAKSTLRWAINNLLCSFILFAYLFYSNNLENKGSFEVFVIVALLNAFLDYVLTWQMYFPRIQDSVENKKKKISKK